MLRPVYNCTESDPGQLRCRVDIKKITSTVSLRWTVPFAAHLNFLFSLLFNSVVAVPTNESQSLGICSGVGFSPSTLEVSIEMHPQHPPALIPYSQIGCRTPCTPWAHCNCAPVCATVPWIQITNAEIFSRGRVRGENSKPAPSTPDPTGQDRTKRREEKRKWIWK